MSASIPKTNGAVVNGNSHVNSNPTTEPIAVIGLGCRLPGGADTPSKLWDLLVESRDCLTEPPKDRFNLKGFYHPDPDHRASVIHLSEKYHSNC